MIEGASLNYIVPLIAFLTWNLVVCELGGALVRCTHNL